MNRPNDIPVNKYGRLHLYMSYRLILVLNIEWSNVVVMK